MSCRIVASSSSSSALPSCMGSIGMCSCGDGCGSADDDDDAVDDCGFDVRCCLCCGLSLWLLVTGVGVLLSPRGERCCRGVVVPSVPCVVVFPVTSGECCGVL